MLRFQYMERDRVTADVEVDYSSKTVKYKPHTTDIYISYLLGYAKILP